jgi:hypothetical protein
MTKNLFAEIAVRRVASGMVAAALSIVNPAVAQQQSVSPAQPAQPSSAISQSGMLPMFGIDLQVEPAWVDGSGFPSSSAKYGNSGVSDALQQTWSLLRQGGFNIVRFPLNLGDAQSATRLANLCLWAKANNVLLVPVLSLDSGKTPTAETAAALEKALISKMRSGAGEQLAAYSQIAYYQIGDRLNHAGLHRGQSRQQLAQQAIAAAEALRNSETAALEGSGVQATPIMMSASYDYELVQQGLISGVPLEPGAQGRATSALVDFLSPFASSPSVDAIAVEWLPRSISAGDVDGFAGLLQALKAAAPGKQLALSTGFSSAFHTPEEQQQFLVLAATNLANLRASEGANPAFVGFIYHRALNGPETTRKSEPNVSQWEWPRRGKELQDLWSGGQGSADIKWWLAKTESNFGLVKLSSGSAPTPLPTLETFQQISASAQQATQAVLPSGSPYSSTSTYPPAGAQYPGTGGQGQYPGGAPNVNGGQSTYGQLAAPADAYPGTGYPFGAGGVSGTDGTASGAPPRGSATQQAIFAMVTQFTNQLTTALVNRLQSRGQSASNYGNGSPNLAPGSQTYPSYGDTSGASSVGGTNQPTSASGISSPPGTGSTGSSTAPAAGTDANAPNRTAPSAGSAAAIDPNAAGTRSDNAPAPAPKIVAFGVMQDATPSVVKSGKKPLFMQALILQLANPADSMSAAVQAEVQMDKKVVVTRPVGPLLAKQSRSVAFGVPTSPGQHNLQVNLKSAEGIVDSATAVVTTSANGAASDTSGSASVAPGTLPGDGGGPGAPAGSNAVTPGAPVNGSANGTSSGNGVPRGMVRLTLPGLRRLNPYSTRSASGGKEPLPPPRPLPSGTTPNGSSVRSLKLPPPRPGGNANRPVVATNSKSGTPPPPRRKTNAANSNTRETAAAKHAATASAGSSKLVRPGPVSSATAGNRSGGTSTTKSLPPRPGPSGAPQRPGATTNAAVARAGSNAAANGTNKMGTSTDGRSTTVKPNCITPSQANQQKNLAPCKPGQNSNCAKPICK